MAIRHKRKDIEAIELPVAADQQERPDEREKCPGRPTRAGATDVPGQPEPSAEAEGECEPELDEAEARRLAQ